ncbi:hypothetical protein BD779DRAFT_1465954 [Infundibulicybe gibba]|nr:hypothetical protein BD779DRAFT_1465954 [Infundibulicybe gibba]
MSQYIDRKTVNTSYRPKSGLMSPGLKRAREPYRVRNALTGLGLAAFAVGIWAYSISAVKQDVFDDIDEEARAMARSGVSSEVLSLEDEKKVMEAAATLVAAKSTAPSASHAASADTQQATPVVLPAVPKQRGVLRAVAGRFPRLLDPQQGTLVWGAPPVDNIGTLSKS